MLSFALNNLSSWSTAEMSLSQGANTCPLQTPVVPLVHMPSILPGFLARHSLQLSILQVGMWFMSVLLTRW